MKPRKPNFSTKRFGSGPKRAESEHNSRKSAQKPRFFGQKTDDSKPKTGKFNTKKTSFTPKTTPFMDEKPPHTRQNSPNFHTKRTEKKSDKSAHLLWGLHAVREALLNPKRICRRLLATQAGEAALQETLKKREKAGLPTLPPLIVNKNELEQLLPRSSVHQGVVLDAAPLQELSIDDLLGQEPSPDLIVVLDQVTDPHNVGAILRSAAALGAGAVIVTERCAPASSGVMAKSASGAAEYVPLIPVVNLARALEALKGESYWCIGLAEEGEHDLAQAKMGQGRIALVMGAEGEGLRVLTRRHCDELARLPTQGPIGSLNVSNAAAVALYEVKRQRT